MRSLLQRSTDLLFSADPMLRVRSSMAMLAVLLMASSAGVMLWLAYAGYGAPVMIAWWAGISVGGQLVMACMVRCGWSAMWRDPSLTFQQILWAITCSAVAYVLAHEAKGVVPGLLAVTLLFAALNLKAKQIVAVSLYAFGAFSLAILFAMELAHGPQPEPAMEVAYAAVLVIMLLGCMLLSLRLYQLRGRLRKQRQELATALAENRELASRDLLTGLINRRHMLELLHLEQRRCLRGVRVMLLAQMDIDHFKSINDTYGHGVGDLALQTFADVVRENIRSSDVLSRWGGEEFVLLISDTDLDGALLTLNDGTLPSFLAEMFPTKVRYTGFAVSFNLSNAIFGGTAPLVATWLIATSGSDLAPGWYLMAAAAVSLVAVSLAAETSRQPLRHH